MTVGNLRSGFQAVHPTEDLIAHGGMAPHLLHLVGIELPRLVQHHIAHADLSHVVDDGAKIDAVTRRRREPKSLRQGPGVSLHPVHVPSGAGILGFNGRSQGA